MSLHFGDLNNDIVLRGQGIFRMAALSHHNTIQEISSMLHHLVLDGLDLI